MLGKEGRIYVIDTNRMGKYTAIPHPCAQQQRTDVDKIKQELPPNTVRHGAWSTAAYWDGGRGAGRFVYTIGEADRLKAWKLSRRRNRPRSSPTRVAIPWFPATARAPIPAFAGPLIRWSCFEPTTRATSARSQHAKRDRLPSYVKFSVPTVAHGRVCVGTQNASVIYGLLSA